MNGLRKPAQSKFIAEGMLADQNEICNNEIAISI